MKRVVKLDRDVMEYLREVKEQTGHRSLGESAEAVIRAFRFSMKMRSLICLLRMEP